MDEITFWFGRQFPSTFILLWHILPKIWSNLVFWLFKGSVYGGYSQSHMSVKFIALYTAITSMYIQNDINVV